MSNEEIIELLRELSQKADEAGEVKSETVRINFGQEEEPPVKNKRRAASKTEMPREENPEEQEEIPAESGEELPDNETGDPVRRRFVKPDLSGLVGKLRGIRKKREDLEDDDLPETDEADESDEAVDDVAADSVNDVQTETETPEISEEDASAEETDDKTAEDSDATKLVEPVKEAEEVGKEKTVKKKKTAKKPSQKKSGQKKPVRKKTVYLDQPTFESDAAEFLEDPAAEAEEDARLAERRAKLQKKIRRLRKSMKAKGLGQREILMIAAGVVLIALIGTILVNVLGNKKKSENVIADEGLTVVVEKEPASWCTHGEVTLGIRSVSPIQTITINSEAVDFSGSNKTEVTFETFSQNLNVVVVSEDQVRTAEVSLRKVDSEDPVITVSQTDGMVSLEAVDSGSGLAGIWVGETLECTDIPGYVPYTEPFKAKEGALYSYFATDLAGNATEPVVTDMTPAKYLSLDREDIVLFPGETGKIQVVPIPESSFVNDLQITNGNKKVVSVAEDGTITALAEGESDIKITADGLAPVVCHVSVRTSVSLTITATGDVTLGEDVAVNPANSFSTMQSLKGNSYFFENVKSIFEDDDITFVNLEGTLTDRGVRAEKEFAFRGDPSYTEILKEGSIEAVTLANNHSRDYGDESLEDTEKYLDEAGIEYCKDEKIILKDVNGVRVALIGIYVLDTGLEKASMVESTIAEAKEAGAQLIVMAFHWGNELETSPDNVQQTLAHTAIDLGADLVVGHHPHVLQGIEKYSGKYICYSLGNFCFGGNTNPSDKDTMIFQQTFEVQRGGSLEGGEAKVIPCMISSTPDWNDYQPTPAVGEQYDRIMGKINDRCEKFKTSFE